MNTHMRRALLAEQNPTIAYHLTRYDVRPNGSETANVSLSGRLSMAGQAKPITIEVSVVPIEGGAVRVTGSQEIIMSEYGMKPPSLMMGTMRVRDRVEVHFDVVLKP
jgi:polyisoprenoid-binding protein YceI